MSETIGFVGLGIMGSGMVKNLASKGHTVHVWSRTEGKAAEFARSLNIEHAKTLKDLAASSSILMLCVTNTHDVRQVVDEAAGSGLKRGSLVIDCSTISPKATEEIAANLRSQGIGFVEEPLAAIAADLGFDDQSHMTRSVKQLTGMTPQMCRKAANGFKTQRGIRL